MWVRRLWQLLRLLLLPPLWPPPLLPFRRPQLLRLLLLLPVQMLLLQLLDEDPDTLTGFEWQL